RITLAPRRCWHRSPRCPIPSRSRSRLRDWRRANRSTTPAISGRHWDRGMSSPRPCHPTRSGTSSRKITSTMSSRPSSPSGRRSSPASAATG
ncbi:MAG: diguanylate cyclase/phosphodiesterase (GGDEF & EAL domains) with PAS/PAC sensor(s), partial [uncultured Thermomicrobiales bacterium]